MSHSNSIPRCIDLTGLAHAMGQTKVQGFARPRLYGTSRVKPQHHSEIMDWATCANKYLPPGIGLANVMFYFLPTTSKMVWLYWIQNQHSDWQNSMSKYLRNLADPGTDLYETRPFMHVYDVSGQDIYLNKLPNHSERVMRICTAYYAERLDSLIQPIVVRSKQKEESPSQGTGFFEEIE